MKIINPSFSKEEYWVGLAKAWAEIRQAELSIQTDKQIIVRETSLKMPSSLPCCGHHWSGNSQKWKLIPFWLQTRARTINNMPTHFPTFTLRLFLSLFPGVPRPVHVHLKGWWSSGCTRILQRSTIWQSISSLQEDMCHLQWTCTAGEAYGTSVHVGTQSSKVLSTRPNMNKAGKKSFGCKAKSCKVRKEKGQKRKKYMRRCGNKVILYTTFINTC